MKKALYWLVSYTWGLPMTLIGTIVAIVLLCMKYKPKIFHHNIYFNVGENRGGLELGAFFIIDNTDSFYLKRHEAGHGIQNLILGVFMPFIITIPSAIRYWYRKYISYRYPEKQLKPYYDIRFEKWANDLGSRCF